MRSSLYWGGASKVGVIQPHQKNELCVCQHLLLHEKLKSGCSRTGKRYQTLIQLKRAEGLEDGVAVHLLLRREQLASTSRLYHPPNLVLNPQLGKNETIHSTRLAKQLHPQVGVPLSEVYL